MESVAYGLEMQSRCICPLYAGEDAKEELHRFLIGTASAVTDNKIYLLEFDDTLRTIDCVAVWPHKDELVSLSCLPAPSERSLLAATTPTHVGLWRVDGPAATPPTQLFEVPLSGARQVLWDPNRTQPRECVVCQPHCLTTLALDDGGTMKERARVELDGHNVGACTAACLDPHHRDCCLVATSERILCRVDMRGGSAGQVMRFIHGNTLHGFGVVSSIDAAAPPSQRLLTGGEDGSVCLLDVQRGSVGGAVDVRRQRSFAAHEHCVNRALFNPFHNELLLSCGSDQAMRLWDTSGSTPHCLKTVADFGDSVVDACWGSNGPWTFAGVSFSGKVVIDTVPSEKRMSILLDEEH